MSAITRRKKDRMLAHEERKLAKLVPDLLVQYGFTFDVLLNVWVARSSRFNCEFRASLIADGCGWPFLASQFYRPYVRPDLPWDNPVNQNRYRDIRLALGKMEFCYYTGKFNCHIFSKMTAIEALARFENHIQEAMG
jgi:hypothetical protein